jgi:hypothetical protein
VALPTPKEVLMKIGDTQYWAAVDAAVPIIEGWAREGQTRAYSDLSRELRARGHRVHFQGLVMSHLLKDVCLRGNEDHDKGMLSAIVVNKSSRLPSGQFFELARVTFERTEPDWSWERECNRVFDDYAEA